MVITMKTNKINPIYKSLFFDIGFESILTWEILGVLNLYILINEGLTNSI